MDEFNKEMIEQETAAQEETNYPGPALEDLVAIIDQETGQSRVQNPAIHLAQKIAQDERRQTEQFVRFGLNETIFGINLANAMEVGQLTSITPLPNLPHWLVGISNIRGEILSIVDLKSFFDWPTTPIKRSNPFIILHNTKIKIGILVDRIMGTMNINQDENLQKVRFDKGKSAAAAFITGVTKSSKEPVYLLDVYKLLNSAQMMNI